MSNVKNKISALFRQLSIVHCQLLIVLLAFTACREDEHVLPGEGPRTITVNLGIAMTRVAEGSTIAKGEANDMKVWVFDQDKELLQYVPVSKPQFTGVDITGDPIETVTTEFDITNVTSLQFRVLLNTEGLNDANGNPLTLNETTTIEQIDAATFKFDSTLPDGDNKVPMYGKCDPITIENKREYRAEIDLTRAVGKLELFFTKESENSALTINGIKLDHIPTTGYLATMPTPAPTGIYTMSEENILTGETSIGTYSDETLGNFSSDEKNFTQLELTQDYLLENPNGGTWTETDANDYTYPYDPENLSGVIEENTRYVMTVNYTIGGTDKTQVIYLPAIERNVWNKVFARVKDDGKLQILYKALPWNKVVSEKGYIPKPMYKNPFSGDEDRTNQYILLPLEKYGGNYSTTNDLFNHLYENPELGDNEARLCILTRPTYDKEIDGDEHWALKTGSAGARYYFMLTGPEGATWEAHLTNTEDFAFSTSVSQDFASNTDEFGNGEVRMVSHGIARKKPYIIQIIAKHLYTGYQKGMSGYTTEDGFDDDGYDRFKEDSFDKWKVYFGDDYLTDWGKAHLDAEEVVDTYFYITVKLKDGQDYVLTINPSYNDAGYKIQAENKDFPFKERRRFAGTDTHIWIRQIRAKHGIEFLEELAKNDSEVWWQNNPDWNPGHKWGNN